MSLRYTPKYDFSLCPLYFLNYLNSLQWPHCSLIVWSGEAEGALRCLESSFSPEFWGSHTFSRIALNSQLLVFGLLLLFPQGLHSPLLPALLSPHPHLVFICPSSVWSQIPASSLPSRPLRFHPVCSRFAAVKFMRRGHRKGHDFLPSLTTLCLTRSQPIPLPFLLPSPLEAKDLSLS